MFTWLDFNSHTMKCLTFFAIIYREKLKQEHLCNFKTILNMQNQEKYQCRTRIVYNYLFFRHFFSWDSIDNSWGLS